MKNRTLTAVAGLTILFATIPVQSWSQTTPDGGKPALGLSVVDGVGLGNVRYARVKIRNQSAESLCRVKVAIAFTGVIGDFQLNWLHGNVWDVAVPDKGEESNWIYIPFSVEGTGQLRLRALLSACDDGPCEDIGVEVEPQALESAPMNIP